MTFSRDNLSAFISDMNGSIKMIKWQAGADSGYDFDFTEEPKRLDKLATRSICLTKDEKYLLVGSGPLLSVLETETREVTKEFKLKDGIMTINLIQDGKQAIISAKNGDLSIINLETMEIKKIAENITNGKKLNKIILI